MKFRRGFAILALCHAVDPFAPLSIKGRNTNMASSSQKYAFYSMTSDPTRPLSAESDENDNFENFGRKNGQQQQRIRNEAKDGNQE